MQDMRSAGAAMALALIVSSSSLAQDVEHAVELEEIVVTASPIGDPDRLATIAGSESAAATATTVMDRLIIFATPLNGASETPAARITGSRRWTTLQRRSAAHLVECRRRGAVPPIPSLRTGRAS